jgi:hypothetical protein
MALESPGDCAAALVVTSINDYDGKPGGMSVYAGSG